METLEKQCTKCGERKPLDAFSPDRRAKNWRQGQCKECRRLAMLADRAANPEKHRAISQKSFARNRKTGTENRLSWKRRNRDKVRGYELKRRYGLTSEDQRRLRDAQDGKCGVCRKPLKERAHTDHDHKTGAVRGMLCGGCNIALGFFEKPGFYEAAMAYLAGHAGVQTGREGSNLTFSTSNAPS